MNSITLNLLQNTVTDWFQVKNKLRDSVLVNREQICEDLFRSIFDCKAGGKITRYGSDSGYYAYKSDDGQQEISMYWRRSEYGLFYVQVTITDNANGLDRVLAGLDKQGLYKDHDELALETAKLHKQNDLIYFVFPLIALMGLVTFLFIGFAMMLNHLADFFG